MHNEIKLRFPPMILEKSSRSNQELTTEVSILETTPERWEILSLSLYHITKQNSLKNLGKMFMNTKTQIVYSGYARCQIML